MDRATRSASHTPCIIAQRVHSTVDSRSAHRVSPQVLEAAARTAHSTSFVSLRFTNIVKRELWDSLPWPAPTAAQPLTLVMWAYCHEDDVGHGGDTHTVLYSSSNCTLTAIMHLPSAVGALLTLCAHRVRHR